jgi:hypothetical protein
MQALSTQSSSSPSPSSSSSSAARKRYHEEEERILPTLPMLPGDADGGNKRARSNIQMPSLPSATLSSTAAASPTRAVPSSQQQLAVAPTSDPSLLSLLTKITELVSILRDRETDSKSLDPASSLSSIGDAIIASFSSTGAILSSLPSHPSEGEVTGVITSPLQLSSKKRPHVESVLPSLNQAPSLGAAESIDGDVNNKRARLDSQVSSPTSSQSLSLSSYSSIASNTTLSSSVPLSSLSATTIDLSSSSITEPSSSLRAHSEFKSLSFSSPSSLSLTGSGTTAADLSSSSTNEEPGSSILDPNLDNHNNNKHDSY